MPKGHRKYDYDYVAFAFTLTGALDLLALSPWQLARKTNIDKRTLRSVIEGKRGLPVTDRRKLIRVLRRDAAAKGVALDHAQILLAANMSPPRVAPGEEPLQTTRLTAPLELATEESRRDASPRYEHWIEIAQQLSAARQRARASEAYQLAEKVAEQDPKILALITAHHANCRSEMDDLGGAQVLLEKTLHLLAADDLRPELGVAADTIERRFANCDLTELRAFVIAAKASAYIWYTSEEFPLAEASCRAFLAASHVLGDANARSEAEHILGKTLVAKGADIDDSQEPERAWRRVRNQADIEQGVAHLKLAQAFRAIEDRVGRLRDLHQEGKALLLLGDVRGAERAGDQARELCGQAWMPIEVPLDQARRALAAGSLLAAHENLRQVLDLAWATQSMELQARSLIGLGELELARPARRQQTLDYCVAAMLAWPFALKQRDFRRTIRLFRRLDATLVEFERSLASGRFPLDTVFGLPHVNAGRLLTIQTHLERTAVPA